MERVSARVTFQGGRSKPKHDCSQIKQRQALTFCLFKEINATLLIGEGHWTRFLLQSLDPNHKAQEDTQISIGIILMETISQLPSLKKSYHCQGTLESLASRQQTQSCAPIEFMNRVWLMRLRFAGTSLWLTCRELQIKYAIISKIRMILEKTLFLFVEATRSFWSDSPNFLSVGFCIHPTILIAPRDHFDPI